MYFVESKGGHFPFSVSTKTSSERKKEILFLFTTLIEGLNSMFSPLCVRALHVRTHLGWGLGSQGECGEQ